MNGKNHPVLSGESKMDSKYSKMINPEYMKKIESWFKNYVHQFTSSDRNYNQNIKLKKDHTYRVCEEIIRVGESLNLSHDDLNLAKTIALLHDVGRFIQYDLYQTFDDEKSEDHAELSIKVIRKEGILKGIDKSTNRIIFFAINHHNKAYLSKHEFARPLFFAKLLRDADKLDIFYVITKYYHNKDEHTNKAIELDLLDTPQISDRVYKDLISRKIVKFKYIENLNDLKLLQMAWIYDINFPITFQLIKERKYLEKIREVLPDSDKSQKAYKAVRNYLEVRCNQNKKKVPDS